MTYHVSSILSIFNSSYRSIITIIDLIYHHHHLHQQGGKHLVQITYILYILYTYPSNLCSTWRQPQQRHQPERGALCGGVSDVKFEVPEMCIRWPRLVSLFFVKTMKDSTKMPKEHCIPAKGGSRILKVQLLHNLRHQHPKALLRVEIIHTICVPELLMVQKVISIYRSGSYGFWNLWTGPNMCHSFFYSRSVDRLVWWQVITRTRSAMSVGMTLLQELRCICGARLAGALRCAARASWKAVKADDVINAREPGSPSIGSTPSNGWP